MLVQEQRGVWGEVFLPSVILLLLAPQRRSMQVTHAGVGGLGGKSKKKHKRQQTRRAPYQRLPVHPLLLENITILRQLQLLQHFFDFLHTPAA